MDPNASVLNANVRLGLAADFSNLADCGPIVVFIVYFVFRVFSHHLFFNLQIRIILPVYNNSDSMIDKIQRRQRPRVFAIPMAERLGFDRILFEPTSFHPITHK